MYKVRHSSGKRLLRRGIVCAGLLAGLGDSSFAGPAMAEVPTQSNVTATDTSADYNRDGKVDFKDMQDFSDQWLIQGGDPNVIPVFGCGFLDESGKVYKLAVDLRSEWGLNSCLTVRANNVSIDLNGHKIVDSTSNTQYGISCVGHSGLTIKNGQLENFQVAGIYLEDCDGPLITDVNSLGNARYSSSISVLRSNRGRMNRVKGCSLWPGKYGLLLSQVGGWEISNSQGLGDIGIHLGSTGSSLHSADGSTVCNSTFYGRTTDVSSSNQDNLFVDCEFESEVGLLSRACSVRIVVPGQNRARVSIYNDPGLYELLAHTNQKGEVPEAVVPWYLFRNGQRENSMSYTIEVKTRDGREAKIVCDANSPHCISVPFN